MICTMRCCRWIVSLKSMCCEECSSSRIPPDPNETSAMARHTPTQYYSDKNFYITINIKRIIKTIYRSLFCSTGSNYNLNTIKSQKNLIN